jgi:hypothetical protein
MVWTASVDPEGLPEAEIDLSEVSKTIARSFPSNQHSNKQGQQAANRYTALRQPG